jgi:hypothetical protein
VLLETGKLSPARFSRQPPFGCAGRDCFLAFATASSKIIAENLEQRICKTDARFPVHRFPSSRPQPPSCNEYPGTLELGSSLFRYLPDSTC